MNSKAFFDTYLIQFFYSFAQLLSASLLFLYLHKAGFSNIQIAVFSMLQYFGAAVVLFFLGSITFRKSISFALVLKSALLLALISFAAGFEAAQLYAIAALSGIVLFMFWVPYNILYLRFADRNSHAFMGSVLFSTWPAVNIFIPALAGFIARDYGYAAIFVLSVVVNLSAFLFLRGEKAREVIPFNLRNAIKNTKGIKTLFFLEGTHQGVIWTVVPLATIGFFSAEVDYGLFFSYLGVFGALAAIMLARMSDRMKNRVLFIYPTLLILGISTIALGFARTVLLWFAANAVMGFFATLTGPFTLAVALDKSKNLVDSMASRELFLNTGRVFGGIAAILSLLAFGISEYALILGGATMLLYPVVIHVKRLYRPKY